MALPDGSITERVYQLISDELYHEAAETLEGLLHHVSKLGDTKECHGLLSLQGYCLYMMKDFEGSAQVYSQLHAAFPDVAEYEFYKNYSLLHCSTWTGAPDFSNKLKDLQDIIANSPHHWRELAPSDAALLESSVLIKQGYFEEGGKVAAAAIDANGWAPALAYNQALCAFQSGDIRAAATIAEEIISRSDLIKDTHTRSVLAPSARRSLHAPAGDALVAAVNLCGAVEIINNKLTNANEELNTIPLGPPEETDCVTAHNQALALARTDPAECIKRLENIIGKPACPPPAVFNLLVLYCKHGHFEAAANLLAQITDADFEVLSQEEAEFLQAFVLLRTAPAEAQQRLEILCCQIAEQLRNIMGPHLNASPYISKNNGIGTAMQSVFAQGVDRLLPALIALVGSYCSEGRLSEAEAQMRRYEDICSEHVVWRTNMAHLVFMQKRYNDCLPFYGHVLNINGNFGQRMPGWQATALAHALAAHVILGDLGQAQQLLDFFNSTELLPNSAEAACEEVSSFWWDKQATDIPHLSFAKLVIGTLYCAEKAYDYGLRTATEAVEPIEKNFSAETWSHVKACFAALLTDLALGVFLVEDQLASHVASFLRRVENKTNGNTQFYAVAEEARALRQMLLQLTRH